MDRRARRIGGLYPNPGVWDTSAGGARNQLRNWQAADGQRQSPAPGNVMAKRVGPLEEKIRIVPLCAWTIDFVIVSPSPAPSLAFRLEPKPDTPRAYRKKKRRSCAAHSPSGPW